MSDIIDKVQKLLALSKAATTAAEAATAAAIANRLIDEHRLTTADLELKNEVVSEPVEDDPNYVYETGKVTTWKQNLLTILARHYGCCCWNDADNSARKISRFRLVGRRSDIGITKYMFQYIMLECSRLADKEAKGMGRVFVQSYCSGFVSGISEQLKSSRVEVQQRATSAAIVKIDSRLEEAKFFATKKFNLVFKTAYSHSRKDSQAFSMGNDRGKSLHLGASLSSGTTKLLG